MLSERSKEKLYNILHKLLFKYNLLCIINTLELLLYKFIPQDYIRNQLDKSLYLQIVCMKAMHNNEEVIYCFNRRQNYLTISLLKFQHKANLNNGQQNFGVFQKSVCGPFTVFKEWKGEFKNLSRGRQFLHKKKTIYIFLLYNVLCSILNYSISEIPNRQTSILLLCFKKWLRRHSSRNWSSICLCSLC